MGKSTFRRVVNVLHRSYVIVSLPVAGGVLFFAGSFCFWPGLGRASLNAGALMFLIGSTCYWAAPFLDYWELTHNQSNLLEPPPPRDYTLSHRQAAQLFEHLYKSHLLRMQRGNCLIYMMGGGLFVGGSVLFFPAMEHLIMHGGWLYIAGCLLTLLGATLGLVTARELKRTARPLAFKAGGAPPPWALPWWGDEDATMVSCALYVAGNLLFIVGSVLFFPKILEAAHSLGGHTAKLRLEQIASVLFVLGSAVFVAGATIDLLVLVRADMLHRGSLWRVSDGSPHRGRGAGAASPTPASLRRTRSTPMREFSAALASAVRPAAGEDGPAEAAAPGAHRAACEGAASAPPGRNLGSDRGVGAGLEPRGRGAPETADGGSSSTGARAASPAGAASPRRDRHPGWAPTPPSVPRPRGWMQRGLTALQGAYSVMVDEAAAGAAASSQGRDAARADLAHAGHAAAEIAPPCSEGVQLAAVRADAGARGPTEGPAACGASDEASPDAAGGLGAQAECYAEQAEARERHVELEVERV